MKLDLTDNNNPEKNLGVVEIIDKRYFTPSIEDIRVGYECEIGHYTYTFPNGLSSASENWTLKVLDEDDVAKITKFRTILEDVELPTIWVRVPYLTKEQIEAEGWINTTNPLNINIWSFEKGNRFIILRMNDLENPFILQVIVKDPSIEELVLGMPSEHFRFTAPCKDINTFRYITKLLNIK
jgi:hypothetical protein